jgi:hypothetical protein
MSSLTQGFSMAELAQLTEDQLNLLRVELERQVRESLEVQNILRASMEPMRVQMLEQNASDAAAAAAAQKRSEG